jgi:hypothetical protein
MPAIAPPEIAQQIKSGAENPSPQSWSKSFIPAAQKTRRGRPAMSARDGSPVSSQQAVIP